MLCPYRGRSIVLAALFALVLLVYFPVRQAEYYSDDDLYVRKNPLVSEGLSPQFAARYFTTPVAGNWHPLTILSLALDAQLWGPAPRVFHLANVVYHALAVGVAFLVLCGLTGAPLRSALVAAVFAAHPLHVEPVAWISGRKDVLSGLLFWLALGAYHLYARRPSTGRWTLVTALFVLGLMSKPILVVLPALLLLLDIWPLNRPRKDWSSRRDLVVEKLPWIALSAAASAIAVVTQSHAGALQSLDNLPLSWRLRNALISAVGYLREVLWPSELTPLHPFSHDPPAWDHALLASLLLAAISALAVLLRRRRPALLTGWLWFVVTLLPVAGFVQLGGQRMADRYLYLPLAGLSIALSWAVARRPGKDAGGWVNWRIGAATLALGALAVAASAQVRYWKNEETLYRRALATARDDEKWLAYHGIGLALYEKDDLRGAAGVFAETIRRRPDYAPAYHGLATVYLRAGNPVAALAHYRMALLEAPEDAGSRHGEGLALAALGRHGEAVAAFRETLRLEPDLAAAAIGLGRSLEALDREAEAIAAYRQALAIDSRLPAAHRALARLSAGGGQGEGDISKHRMTADKN
jgi:Tfp pilus assembly protein PilF